MERLVRLVSIEPLCGNEMDPIPEIKARFKKYPDAQYEEGDGYIRYLPSSPEGFTACFQVVGDEFIVYFDDGWHEHFDDPEEALECFAWGLSDECRLKIISRGLWTYKWSAEWLQDGNWSFVSTTGLLWPFPFWRRRRIEFKQNTLIKS